jgi:hypothetical protein
MHYINISSSPCARRKPRIGSVVCSHFRHDRPRSANRIRAKGRLLRQRTTPIAPRGVSSRILLRCCCRWTTLRSSQVGLTQSFSNLLSRYMSRRAQRSSPTGANRSQRAPPQPFRARVARNFQPASNQVFCESSPHSRPGAPAR